MKRLFIFCAVVTTLGLGLYALGRFPEKWLEDAKAEHQERVRAWESEVEARNGFPNKVKRVDALLDKKEYSKAESALAELELSVPEALRPALTMRRAEIKYRLCELHIIGFDYFSSPAVEDKRAAGEERDRATAACSDAGKLLASVKSKDAEFYRTYNEGNHAVRKAIIATSLEAQMEALKTAIRSYKKSLDAANEDAALSFDPRINLELLFSLQKNAENAAKGQGKGKEPMAPDQFQLKPRDPGPGATGGSGSKSKL